MSDRRERNIEIFKDSEDLMNTDAVLKKAAADSISGTLFYPETEEILLPADRKAEGKTIVSKKRSLEAAEGYVKAGKKVCVLNFASATNPGGGVKSGSSAQEESLCRCSTLYPCLNTGKLRREFYEPHRRADDPLYNDDCIYTPGIVVFKSDSDSPERLKKKDRYMVDVITCAAPNLRNVAGRRKIPDERELSGIYIARIERIFRAAAANGAQVLILGAFGCGAFCNPPALVAEAFKIVSGEYGSFFETMEYPVFCREYETENYETFERILEA